MSRPTVLSVLLDELRENPDAAGDLARLLAPFFQPRATSTDGWIGAREAAAHVGVSVAALHRLTAARAIPFAQDGPGCRCWFRRSELDRWRQGGAVQSRARDLA